jgi:hypothetical protein
MDLDEIISVALYTVLAVGHSVSCVAYLEPAQVNYFS